MARRRTRKKNPESGATSLLMIGGIAVAGYLAYVNGWLSSLFGTTAAATTTGTTTTGTAAPVTGSVSPTAASVVGTPPLGTVVHNNTDLMAQVAAQLPYIMPDNSTIGSAPALLPEFAAGYTLATDAAVSETGTTGGSLYLRNDVAQALLDVLANQQMQSKTLSITPYVPLSLATLYTSPFQNLAQLHSIMASAGLSGLGFVHARSNYPYNPIVPAGWN
jgi:hypothetical protein